MGIRVKILFIIVVVFALLLAVAGVVLNRTVFDNLTRLEHEDVSEQANRLEELIAQQLLSLSGPVQDWAAWDETFNYIAKPNAAFEKVNLSSKSLDLVKFNLLAVLDAKGQTLVHVDNVGGAYRLSRTLPPEIHAQVMASRQISTGECGMLVMKPYPLLFCIRPVMPSEMDKPSNGYLLVGRYLHQERMEELRRAMKQSVNLRFDPPLAGTVMPVEGDSGQYQVTFNPLGERQYEVFKEFKGADGKPAFWFRFVYERTRAEQSTSVLVRMLTWVTGSLWAVVMLLYFLLERVLLRRLYKLEEVVGQASKSHDWATAVPHTGDKDEIGRLASGIEELFSEMSKNVSQLEAQSLEDALTRLPNRRNFDQKLEFNWLICQRHRQALTVMMIDIDHFKQFNDQYGHQAGDETLIRVATALRSALYRPTDFVARYGGEEFAVILPDSNGVASADIAERLRRAVEDVRISHRGSTMGQITISVGVASCDTPRLDMHGVDLLRHADMALYQAKADGRNRTKIVDLTLLPDQRDQ